MDAIPALALRPFRRRRGGGPIIRPRRPGLSSAVLARRRHEVMSAFTRRVSLAGSSVVLRCNTNARGGVTSFSRDTLRGIGSGSLKRINALLAGIMARLGDFSRRRDGKFLKVFGGTSGGIRSVGTGCSGTRRGIGRVIGTLSGRRIRLLGSITVLSGVCSLGLACFGRLSVCVLTKGGGLRRMEDARLTRLVDGTRMDNLPRSTRTTGSLSSVYGHFRGGLRSLRLAEVVSVRATPRVHLIRGGSARVMRGVRSAVIGAVPL